MKDRREKKPQLQYVPLIVSNDRTQNIAYGTVRSSNEIGFSSIRRWVSSFKLRKYVRSFTTSRSFLAIRKVWSLWRAEIDSVSRRIFDLFLKNQLNNLFAIKNTSTNIVIQTLIFMMISHCLNKADRKKKYERNPSKVLEKRNGMQ